MTRVVTGRAVAAEPRPARGARVVVRHRASTLALAAAVAVGVALRVRQWTYGRSLWLDEISIALNLETRSYGDLLGRLDSGQVAPFGWLWTERWLLLHVGDGERALRLLPLGFGCGALVVLALLARRVLSAWASGVAVGLAALLPPLVYYSNDLKQYSSDSFWVPLMALLTLRCLDAGASRWRFAAWAGAASVGALFSQAHLLAVGGFGIALLVGVLRRRDRRRLASVVVSGTVVVAAAAAVYVVQLSELSGDESLTDFWFKQGGFVAPGAGLRGHLAWLVDRAVTLPAEPTSLAPGLLGLALLVLGARTLARREAAGLAVLCAPLGVAVLAALVGAYPLAGRVSLYLVPLGLVVAAAAVDVTARRRVVQGVTRAGVVIALVAVAVPSVTSAGREVAVPREVSETRAAFDEVAAGFRPGDQVFTYFTAGSSALWYVPKVDVPWDGNLYLVDDDNPVCAQHGVGPALRRGSRAWLVFGIPLRSQARDEREVVLAHLGASARLVSKRVDTGAATYLFDTTSTPVGPRPVPRDCLIDRRPPRLPILVS